MCFQRPRNCRMGRYFHLVVKPTRGVLRQVSRSKSVRGAHCHLLYTPEGTSWDGLSNVNYGPMTRDNNNVQRFDLLGKALYKCPLLLLLLLPSKPFLFQTFFFVKKKSFITTNQKSLDFSWSSQNCPKLRWSSSMILEQILTTLLKIFLFWWVPRLRNQKIEDTFNKRFIKQWKDTFVYGKRIPFSSASSLDYFFFFTISFVLRSRFSLSSN